MTVAPAADLDLVDEGRVLGVEGERLVVVGRGDGDAKLANGC